MRRLLTSLLIILAAGCATVWPEQCEVVAVDGTRTRVCSCQVLTVRAAPLTKRVQLLCDGKALPIEAVGKELGKLCR